MELARCTDDRLSPGIINRQADMEKPSKIRINSPTSLSGRRQLSEEKA
jgi:hypothetical protein